MPSPTSGPPSDPLPDPLPEHGRDRQHRQRLKKRLSLAFAIRVRSARSRSWGWRLTAPAVFVLAGALFVTSAVSSGGTDLRAGRYDDLPGLAEAQADQVESLRQRQEELAAEVDDLTESLGDTDAVRAQEQADAVAGPAGLEPVRGPGVTVTLTDAPGAVIDTIDTIDPTVNVNNLVVHQQDIQAVVNALWAGGAEAMTVQGQRVVSTTGIRCVGNTVILHGVPYAPPYVISAIGSPEAMLTSLDRSPYIGFYLEAVAAYQVGWDVRAETEIGLPAYTGSTELNFARPVGDPVAGPDDAG